MKKDMNMMGFLEAGKGTATCAECNTNWKKDTIPTTCPFCGSKAILFVKEQ